MDFFPSPRPQDTITYVSAIIDCSSANKCLLKVAAYAAQLEQYQKAIEIYEQVRARALVRRCRPGRAGRRVPRRLRPSSRPLCWHRGGYGSLGGGDVMSFPL